MWALFGYKENDNMGDFLAERNTKEELKEVEDLAKTHGYVKFSYSHADGTLPIFSDTVIV